MRSGRVAALAYALAMAMVMAFAPAGVAAPPTTAPPTTAPPTTAPPTAPAAIAGPAERHYPPRRAAELKARLLERQNAGSIAAWAAEYCSSPEIARLEPVSRAAEQLWAARIGLTGEPSGDERKVLRSVIDRLEGCPLDSIAVKRAAIGLTKVGVVVPLSGRFERYGETFVNGLRVAFEEHDREYAPNVSLVLYDSEGDPLVGARKARWLLKDHGVSLLIGELFTAGTAPLAAATQVVGAVLLSPSATNERLATLGEGVFQLHVGQAALAAALARYVKGTNPRASIAVLSADGVDDSLAVRSLTVACANAGVRLAGVERVGEGTVDVTKQLASLKAKRATALVLVGPPRLVGVAAPQIGSIWSGVLVAGFESLDPEGLSREAREALEGASFFAPDYALLGAPRDTFAVAYARSFKEAPTRMSVRGYLVGLAVTRALQAGCVNAAQLRETLRGQLLDSDEGRALRALRPAVPAEPERLVIRSGRAILPDSGR